MSSTGDAVLEAMRSHMDKEAGKLTRFLGGAARGKGELMRGLTPVEPNIIQRGAKRLQNVVGRRQAESASKATRKASDAAKNKALAERRASKLQAVRRGMGKGQAQPPTVKVDAVPKSPAPKPPTPGPQAAPATAAPKPPKPPKPDAAPKKKGLGVKGTLAVGGTAAAGGSMLTGAGAGGAQAVNAPQASAQHYPPGY